MGERALIPPLLLLVVTGCFVASAAPRSSILAIVARAADLRAFARR